MTEHTCTTQPQRWFLVPHSGVILLADLPPAVCPVGSETGRLLSQLDRLMRSSWAH